MKIIAWAVLATLWLAGASHVHGFDGQRKGFVLGGGAGGSLTSYRLSVSGYGMSSTSDRENSGGASTRLVIGGGLSNTLLLTYFADAAWFRNVDGDELTFANGVAGAQLVLYQRERSPSPYVYAGAGWSSWSTPFEDRPMEPWSGLGVALGAGYEFARHWSVQLGFFATNPSDVDQGFRVGANSLGLHAQVVGLAY